jgi:hypothetical protein
VNYSCFSFFFGGRAALSTPRDLSVKMEFGNETFTVQDLGSGPTRRGEEAMYMEYDNTILQRSYGESERERCCQ